MKKKLLIVSIVLTTMTSSFVFAAEGHGYRILKEEIISASPGFHIEQVAPGTAAKLKKKSLTARTKTSVPSKSGRINQYIQVDGYHDFTITNNTHQRQTYEKYVALDCDNLHEYYRRYIEVEPGGYYTDSDHTYGVVQEAYSGSYRISAETKASGESSDSSRDSNTLYVSK